MTYEDASEVEVLKSYWRPGAPLENTVFVLLDPSGRPLARGAREPGMYFRSASDMASALNQIASHYQPTGYMHNLPEVSTVRLGMNVAACDKLPLAIVVADNAQERQALERNLAPLSWSGDFIGKLTYTAGSRNDLNNIRGTRISHGYLFVSPDEFGTSATVIAQLLPNASTADLKSAMQATIERHHPTQMEYHEHINVGRQEGIHWTPATPITDPHELQAERMRGGGGGGMGMGPGGFGGPPGGPGGGGPSGGGPGGGGPGGGFGPPGGSGFGPPGGGFAPPGGGGFGPPGAF